MRKFTIEFIEFPENKVKCNGVWGDRLQATELENLVSDKAQVLFLEALNSIFPESITGVGISNESLEDAIAKANIESDIRKAGGKSP